MSTSAIPAWIANHRAIIAEMFPALTDGRRDDERRDRRVSHAAGTRRALDDLIREIPDRVSNADAEDARGAPKERPPA